MTELLYIKTVRIFSNDLTCVMQLQLFDSHAASGQMVMLSEFHNLPSQNLAPNFEGGLT